MVRLARILVPVDFSSSSDAAVEEAFFLAKRFEASVDLMHVWRPTPTPEEEAAATSLTTFAHSDVGQEMRKYLEQAEEAGVPANGRLAYGDPEKLILDSSADYDLIVMGTRGRGAVSHVLRPSITEHVVRRASIPVLTVHAPVTAEAPREEQRAEESGNTPIPPAPIL
jgi:nucleotide-binding universal stress UspA family protein